MDFYQIKGKNPLSGMLTVHGAKNSVLPILAATLLASGQSTLYNCPELTDVSITMDILRELGCQVRREGSTLVVDASQPTSARIPHHLMQEMRSSIVFLGALLSRMGEGQLSYPGGCELGPRPIDLHLSSLRALGAEIKEQQGMLIAKGGNLVGKDIFLSIPSVGATQNLMLAACGAVGTTTIVGAAKEPEIIELQTVLQKMGAKVWGAGSSVIQIEGGYPLHGIEHHIQGDRIVAATYLCAVAACGGDVTVQGVSTQYMGAVLDGLERAGCHLQMGQKQVRLQSGGKLQGISMVRTAPYPGFPTDARAIFMAALSGGTGTTMFEENLFDSRYRHVDELSRMGANIQVSGRVAVVTGRELHGAQVNGTDLRGAAALVVAALSAQGESQVTGLHHIRRGYERLEQALRGLGASIALVQRT